MARRAPKSSLTPKMLQHFAVATVAITACLVLFADGEGQNQFGQEVASQGHAAEAAVAAAGARIKPKFSLQNKIADARKTYVPLGVDSADSGLAYGAPMDGGSSGGGGGGGGGGGPLSRSESQMVGPAVLPTDQSEPSGPPVPGKFLPGQGDPQATGRRPAQPRRPTREEIQRLEEMSRARSGG